MSEPFIEKHAISTELSNVNREKHGRKSYRVCRHDREPRIPIRSLKRLRNKSRKVRKFVYARILSCIPIQGRIQEFLKGGLYTIVVTFHANGVKGE